MAFSGMMQWKQMPMKPGPKADNIRTALQAMQEKKKKKKNGN